MGASALAVGLRPLGFGSGRDTASLRSKWRTPSEASRDGVRETSAGAGDGGDGVEGGGGAPGGARWGRRAQRAGPTETPREGDGSAVAVWACRERAETRRERGPSETRREPGGEPVDVLLTVAARPGDAGALIAQ